MKNKIKCTHVFYGWEKRRKVYKNKVGYLILREQIEYLKNKYPNDGDLGVAIRKLEIEE